MNARADNTRALGAHAQGLDHQGADRREHDRAVELLRRRFPRCSGPLRAEAARESLSVLVARAREREHSPSLVEGELAENVCGGSEAVEADALRLPDKPQRSIPDQAGAQQRRGLLVGIAGRDREAEALVGDHQLGVAAVNVIAGEASPIAQVLASA